MGEVQTASLGAISDGILSNGVTTFTVQADLLVGGKANLCLLQTSPVGLETIRNDRSRPESVAALCDLLVGTPGRHAAPVLGELIAGHQPAVVLVPECALGSGDWTAVDAFVRGAQQPVLLIAGFGAAKGEWLLRWALGEEAPSPTARRLSWNQQTEPIAASRAVNGGSCWIHGFGNPTMCIAFIKNYLEQSTEAVALASLNKGTSILHLQFRDVDVLPLICADLVQPRSVGSGAAQARIECLLANNSHRNCPILVTGSVLQTEPHNNNWQIAINDVTNNLSPTRQVVLALANQACDSPCGDEDKDCWRSLSGVYGRFSDLPHGQKGLDAGRPVSKLSIAGAVVRDTRPCVVAGPISWAPYGPTVGAFLWHSEGCLRLEPNGIASPLCVPPKICTYEIHRFTRRFPPDAAWSPRVNEGLDRIRSHLEEAAAPDAERLLKSLLSGVTDDSTADPERLHDLVTPLDTGLYALATLRTIDSMVWQGDIAKEGQLFWPAEETHVLVWRDKVRSGREMRRELEEWSLSPGAHPRLLVVAEGHRTPVIDGPVRGDRRSDVSRSPSGGADLGQPAASQDERDFSMPHSQRSVGCVRLEYVSEYYVNHDPDAGVDAGRFAQLVEKLRHGFDGSAP